MHESSYSFTCMVVPSGIYYVSSISMISSITILSSKSTSFLKHLEHYKIVMCCNNAKSYHVQYIWNTILHVVCHNFSKFQKTSMVSGYNFWSQKTSHFDIFWLDYTFYTSMLNFSALLGQMKKPGHKNPVHFLPTPSSGFQFPKHTRIRVFSYG